MIDWCCWSETSNWKELYSITKASWIFSNTSWKNDCILFRYYPKMAVHVVPIFRKSGTRIVASDSVVIICSWNSSELQRGCRSSRWRDANSYLNTFRRPQICLFDWRHCKFSAESQHEFQRKAYLKEENEVSISIRIKLGIGWEFLKPSSGQIIKYTTLYGCSSSSSTCCCVFTATAR